MPHFLTRKKTDMRRNSREEATRVPRSPSPSWYRSRRRNERPRRRRGSHFRTVRCATCLRKTNIVRYQPTNRGEVLDRGGVEERGYARQRTVDILPLVSSGSAALIRVARAYLDIVITIIRHAHLNRCSFIRSVGTIDYLRIDLVGHPTFRHE